MKILGIDPGTLTLGFSVIEGLKNPKLITAGTIKLPRSQYLSKRLKMIYDELTKIILVHNTQILGLEMPFSHLNKQTFMKLGYVRGILLLLAEQHNMEIREFAPTQVKQNVTGSGAATKADVAWALSLLFPAYGATLKTTNNHDMTDAIAVGVSACR